MKKIPFLERSGGQIDREKSVKCTLDPSSNNEQTTKFASQKAIFTLKWELMVQGNITIL